jgi:hypothetical protein
MAIDKQEAQGQAVENKAGEQTGQAGFMGKSHAIRQLNTTGNFLKDMLVQPGIQRPFDHAILKGIFGWAGFVACQPVNRNRAEPQPEKQFAIGQRGTVIAQTLDKHGRRGQTINRAGVIMEGDHPLYRGWEDRLMLENFCGRHDFLFPVLLTVLIVHI